MIGWAWGRASSLWKISFQQMPKVVLRMWNSHFNPCTPLKGCVTKHKPRTHVTILIPLLSRMHCIYIDCWHVTVGRSSSWGRSGESPSCRLGSIVSSLPARYTSFGRFTACWVTLQWYIVCKQFQPGQCVHWKTPSYLRVSQTFSVTVPVMWNYCNSYLNCW